MRPTVAADTVPRLPRHVKLRHDKARDRWLILVPERVLVPDYTAVAVLSRFRDRQLRLEWRHRIEDHDGFFDTEGGIERWLKLTDGLGLDRAYVESTQGILAATRFAVDAYVHFVRDRTPLEAIASSLTELFAPNLHEERISGMLKHYDFINPAVMTYFQRRLDQAPRDADFALRYVREHARTPEERQAVCDALTFKTDCLWVQQDALYHAYVNGHVPPGAFRPEGM